METAEEPPVYTPSPRRGLDALLCITAFCYDFVVHVLTSILFVFHLIYMCLAGFGVIVAHVIGALVAAILIPFQLLLYVSIHHYKCWLVDCGTGCFDCPKPEACLYNEYRDTFRVLECGGSIETRIIVNVE